MEILAFIIGAILFLAAAGWDSWRSLQQPLFTSGEKNKLYRGKDGYFSLTKGIIYDFLIVVVPAIILSAIFGLYAGAAWFAVFAVVIVLRLQKTWRNYKEAKKEQFELFAILKRDPAHRPEGEPRQFQFDDQFIWKPFYDIRVFADSMPEAKERLFTKLAKLAAKGSGEWWVKDRAKDL